LRAVRRNNAREAALRHDCLHRIRVVFDTLGLAPTAEMRARATARPDRFTGIGTMSLLYRIAQP
jgi:hypothetical protein